MAKNGTGVNVDYFKEGYSLGEISLILNRPRMASVRTAKTTELLELEKATAAMV
jgi:CRP-like cAMP-binding protein